EAIYVRKPSSSSTRDETSVSMPMSFMTGSVVGKRFYRDATVRRADDGNGWTVMLDYRTLKTPAKRPLKLHSRTLAMAVAAEWEYQVLMPLLLSSPSCSVVWVTSTVILYFSVRSLGFCIMACMDVSFVLTTYCSN
uniref:Uncharacterized protein n=1 Tax=Aegilops tauschii subsp. strangulata TaxID=200361 RepID=A0A453AX80_AEGTS